MSNISEKLARKGAPKGPTAQVRLNVRHLSVWSATKIAFLIGLILGIFGIAATMATRQILVATGGFAQIDTLLGGAFSTSSGASITSTISFGLVLAIAVAIAALTVIGTTVLGVLVAVLYNASTRLTDGLLVGFSER
jgi:hypothetical protein